MMLADKQGEYLEGYLGKGEAYRLEEEDMAAEIRAMTDLDERETHIKFFEVETGKKFPETKGIRVGLNMDTFFLSSRQISMGAEFILSNPRLSRKSIRDCLGHLKEDNEQKKNRPVYRAVYLMRF